MGEITNAKFIVLSSLKILKKRSLFVVVLCLRKMILIFHSVQYGLSGR